MTANSHELHGWSFTGRKAHYFDSVGNTSLCGKWVYYRGPMEIGNDNSPDNCLACKRKLARRQVQGQEEANGR